MINVRTDWHFYGGKFLCPERLTKVPVVLRLSKLLKIR